MSVPAANATLTDLTGLSGASWTGFLAALGVLRLLTEAGLPVRLGWGSDAPYTACLAHSLIDAPGIAERVAAALERQVEAFDPFPGRHKLSEVTPVAYRAAVASAMQRSDRLALDILAAFGSDAAFEPTAPPKSGSSDKPVRARQGGKNAELAVSSEGRLLDPPWCVLNGAQQRNLLDIVRYLRDLAKPPVGMARRSRGGAPIATAQPLARRMRSVLEGPWQEIDRTASLYLDPSLREHAYRWSDPTSEPLHSDGIANLLALVGLSLFPAVPVDNAGTVALASACCAPIDSRRNAVSWPIWRGMLGVGAARRLLLMPGLTSPTGTIPADLASRGIVVVMRTEVYPIEGAKGARTYTFPEPVWRP